MSGIEGVFERMPEAVYHSRPELSSTGARKLLKSPALFRYAMDHAEEPKPEFDLGTLVHSHVLGVGARVAVYPEELLASNGAASTAAAKAWAAEVREGGDIPVKADAADAILGMAEAVLAHGEASRILEAAAGREVSLFATDLATGVDMRARFDVYGELECADLKTARDASPKGFTRAVWDHRYDIQQEWYLKARELVVGDRPAFSFIAVETAPPYLVAVYRLGEQWQEIGDVWAAHARTLYRMCSDADAWPGYGSEVHELMPPVGLVYEHQERFESAGIVI